MEGGHAWWGGACMARGCTARGHAWQGACMGGLCGRGGMCGRGVQGRRDGHYSEWYASYWNAFLFFLQRPVILDSSNGCLRIIHCSDLKVCCIRYNGRSKGGVRHAPRESKFVKFHAVFGKFWQNRMLAPPWRVGAPTSGKSWIQHCINPDLNVYITAKPRGMKCLGTSKCKLPVANRNILNDRISDTRS